MLNLQDREWKTFYISNERDDGIFTLRASLSGIDKNKLADADDKRIPYITRSDFNNGVSLFVGKEQRAKYKMDRGNVITIGLDTQTVFYQPHSFYTGQNIQILFNEHINRYTATFIIPLLKKQVSKLSWGGNGATLGRLKRMQLLLPINEKNLPDYDFMEQYIKERESCLIEKYKDYIIKNIQSSGGGATIINSLKWQAFYINEIFNISAGKRLTRAAMDSGRIPFIGATDSNNGITNWIATPNSSFDKNVLGVNYNGSVVENFYHPYSCVFSDDVKRLHLKNHADNKYVLLFFKTVLLQQKIIYTYGYKFNSHRMDRQKILLPVNDKGNPDYELMEQYGKQIMLQKSQQYIKYINARE